MRKEFIQCATYKEAVNAAPWAAIIAKCWQI